MSYSPLLNKLIEAFQCLPGIGPKSAQRMSFHLLERDRDRGQALANTVKEALERIQRCEQCRTFSETPLCGICENTRRNQQLLCIVESPADVLAIENTGGYRGLYFVLMGHLSPLDGVGPEEVGIPLLHQRLKEGGFEEVILATNTTVEGEATAHYIAEVVKNYNIISTRIAHGIPLGGELEYIDAHTLAHALANRVAWER